MTHRDLINEMNVRCNIWSDRQAKLGVVFRDESRSPEKRIKAFVLGMHLGQRLYNYSNFYLKLTSLDATYEKGGNSTVIPHGRYQSEYTFKGSKN